MLLVYAIVCNLIKYALFLTIRSKEHRLGEMVIRSARSLLLVIQNDSSLSILVERLVEGRGVSGKHSNHQSMIIYEL